MPAKPVDAGAHLDQLARETGGRSFRIRRANELASVYETIRQELRSQYLLAYQSSRLDGSTAFREISGRGRAPGRLRADALRLLSLNPAAPPRVAPQEAHAAAPAEVTRMPPG